MTDGDGHAPIDPRGALDARIDSPGREGLTGTAPASLFAPLREADQITVPPDGRPMEQQPGWRQDFSIDWPQDLFVARRDFVKFLVLTSCAFATGQLWIAAQSLRRRGQAPPAPRRIASLRALAVGSTTLFDYPTEHDPCVLVRLDGERLVAYAQRCTHLACSVVPRPGEGTIHCPCHEGIFDLASGRPTAGPPRRPLPMVTLEVRGDDVYATGIVLRTT